MPEKVFPWLIEPAKVGVARVFELQNGSVKLRTMKGVVFPRWGARGGFLFRAGWEEGEGGEKETRCHGDPNPNCRP